MDNVLFCSVKDVYSQSLLGQLVELVLDNHETEYHSFSLPLAFVSINTKLKSALPLKLDLGMSFFLAGICKTRLKSTDKVPLFSLCGVCFLNHNVLIYPH